MSLDPKVLNDAANEIRTAATRQRALLALADALVGVASIENAANEAQARLDRLRADETALVASHLAMAAGAEKDAKARVDDADAYHAKRAAEADGLVASAATTAAQIIADAQRDAAKLEADVDSALADRRAQLGLANGSLAAVNVAIDTQRTALAALAAEIDAKQEVLAQLTEQHQAFLAKIGAK